MGSFIDTIMLIAFVLFMVWLIRGYHANKYEERYGDNSIKSTSKDVKDKK